MKLQWCDYRCRDICCRVIRMCGSRRRWKRGMQQGERERWRGQGWQYLLLLLLLLSLLLLRLVVQSQPQSLYLHLFLSQFHFQFFVLLLHQPNLHATCHKQNRPNICLNNPTAAIACVSSCAKNKNP